MNVNAKLEGFGVYNNREKMAPAFKLAASTGTKIASWDYKQRQPLVLYFIPRLEETFLQQLEEVARELQAYGTEVLVLLPLPVEDLKEAAARLKLSVPLLSDESGETYRKYLKLILPEGNNNDSPEELEKTAGAAVFVADRFGAISRFATATKAADLPGQSDIMAMLEFLGNLCNP
ncbi:MAG: redoxin protein [Chloroflexi bacterium]|nr:redoxin protein [Chloroflexota bacterium]